VCMLCRNATTREETVSELHGQIAQWGFTIFAVGSFGHRGWAYTIGLLELKNHPEIVVAGWPLGGAVNLLSDMGTAVAAGKRYDVGGPAFSVGRTDLGVVPVHEAHLERGLMNAWHWYYEGVGRFELEPSALQAVLPDADHCFEHQRLQPRLDDPRHVAFDGRSREERRGHRGNQRIALHPSTPRRRGR
jgi:Domain of unknown function (DUF4262)